MTRCALAICVLVVLPSGVLAQETPAGRTSRPDASGPVWVRASRPDASGPVWVRASRPDGVLDGLWRGAALGALAPLPLALAQMGSCDTGCDWASTPALLLGWSMIGAAAGSVVGVTADADAPARLSPRIGAAFRTTTMGGGDFSGSATAPVMTLSVQLSRHVSVHAEYASVGRRFPAAPGAVPDEILNNVVTEIPSSRPAGWRRAIESRRVDFIFTELVGVHVSPWRRVRLEVVGGLGVQGEEERAYYDAYRTVTGTITERVPGKYYVLDFESPEVGPVFGIDAEVHVTRGLALVPTFRYHAFGGSSSSLAYGAGLHWRF